MVAYRLYVISAERQRTPGTDLDCPDDATALYVATEAARNGATVEVWVGSRFVGQARGKPAWGDTLLPVGA